MKKHSLLFLPLLTLFVTGCNLSSNNMILNDVDASNMQNESSTKEIHKLSVIDNPYGTVILHKYEGKKGDPIAINYFPAYKYVLDHFEVNGVSIDKANTFFMPDEDVFVEGIFVNAIEDTPYMIKVQNTTSLGESYWYFNKNEKSLDITIKVIDATIYNDVGYLNQDYCEFIMQPIGSSSWIKNRTISFGVTIENECFYRVAVSGTMMGDPKDVKDVYNVSTTFSKKFTNYKHGYTGYEFSISIPYEDFGFDLDSFYSNYLFNFCFHNAESPNTFGWSSYRSWLGPSEYINL